MLDVLLYFYLLIATNFLTTLYSGQLIDFLKDNRTAQHVIGFITMLALFIALKGADTIKQAIIYALISYSWFVASTKLDLSWNLVIIALLIVGYLCESKISLKEKQVDEDSVLNLQEKDKIKNKNKLIKRTILGSITVITLIGLFMYYNKKQVQYGGQFDDLKFIFNGKN